jgi:hypothetical protein
MKYISQKLAQTYYQCLKLAKTAHFNCSFLLTLALKPWTCAMALFVTAFSKISPKMIKIQSQCDRYYGTL